MVLLTILDTQPAVTFAGTEPEGGVGVTGVDGVLGEFGGEGSKSFTVVSQDANNSNRTSAADKSFFI
jgi:hypothetical protein